AQGVVRGELGDLWAAGASLRVPLRRRGPIHARVASRGRVAAQLPRDRRRGPTQTASDLTHPDTLGVQDRDLLALSKRQVTPRQRDQRDWRHPTTVTEPPAANRRRHAGNSRGIPARDAGRDRPPKPHTILTPRHRRPTRRPGLTTHRTGRPLTLAP